MLSHELVELVQRLRVFRRRVICRVLLWARPALLGVGRRRLAAVAAHEGRQDGGVVHPPVQPAEQHPHARADHSRVGTATAAAVVFICTSSPHRKRLHLQLLPSSPSVRVLSGSHADGVLPTVAEATVLVLMVLQQVMDRPQPQRAVGARPAAAPAGTVAVSVTPAVTAATASIRVHLFTTFTGEKTGDMNVNREGMTSRCVFSTSKCVFSTSRCVFSTSRCVFYFQVCVFYFQVCATSRCVFSTSRCVFSTSRCVFLHPGVCFLLPGVFSTSRCVCFLLPGVFSTSRCVFLLPGVFFYFQVCFLLPGVCFLLSGVFSTSRCVFSTSRCVFYIKKLVSNLCHPEYILCSLRVNLRYRWLM